MFRYIDDMIIAVSKDWDNSDMAAVLGSWHKNFVVLVSHSANEGEKIPFLDLHLNVTAGHLTWELFRKPANKYSYLHRASCHPEGTFESVVASETHRIFRCHSDVDKVPRALLFFKCKLRARGYTCAEVDRWMAKVIAKRSVMSVRPPRAQPFRLRAMFSFDSKAPLVARVCKQCTKLLPKFHGAKFGVSWSIQKSRLQRLYRQNWRLQAK